MHDYVGVNVKMNYLEPTVCTKMILVHLLYDLDFYLEGYPILSPCLIKWLYMTKHCSTTNIFLNMVIKAHFDMTLTYDLEDHMCIYILCG